MLKLGDPRTHRIYVLAARRAIGHEARAVVDYVHRHRLGRNADHRLARRDFLGHDRISANLRPLADLDRAKDLSAGPDHHTGADGRMTLASYSGVRIGAAERDVLVDGDVI